MSGVIQRFDPEDVSVMFRYFVFFMVVAIGITWILAQPVHSKELPRPEELVKKIKDVYKETCCFQASFDQLTVNVAMDLKDRFRGMIYVKKPASIALKVTFPEKQEVVLKGRSYTVYFPSDKAAVTGEIPPDINIESFLGFFVNIGEMDKNFEAHYAKKEQSARDNLYFLELLDMHNLNSSHRVTLGIDRDTYIIRRAVIHDALSNYNRFDLSGVVFRSSLPDEIFEVGEKGSKKNEKKAQSKPSGPDKKK